MMCRICRPGNGGGRFAFCQPCVEVIRESHACPDCDSEVYVVDEVG